LFAVVQHDSAALELDPAGNARVLDLLLKTGKKPVYIVSVAGHRTGDTIQLDGIALTK
jgi:ribosomal protein L2